MKCLICGKEINDGVVCNECSEKVTEELCYKVAQYDYHNPDNEVWGEVIRQLDEPFKFRGLSLELSDYVDEKRREFVKLQCMNKMNSSKLGISVYNSDFVLEYAKKNIDNDTLSNEEINLSKAFLLQCYEFKQLWELTEKLSDSIDTDSVFIDTALILSDYYMKLRRYTQAIEILEKAKADFKGDDVQDRISKLIENYKGRENGSKKAYAPQNRDNKIIFYEYLDKCGIEHERLKNPKRKIKESEFKPFKRYENGVPGTYISLWFTAEYYMKADEVVEVSALHVTDGKITDRFQSFIYPINESKNPKYVKKEDFINAPVIRDVFCKLLDFIKDDIVAIAGFETQKVYFSRLARYSLMDHVDNEIFDVVEYGEDISEDFSTYTRSSLLEKYEVSEGESGMEKAEATVKLVEKMR